MQQNEQAENTEVDLEEQAFLAEMEAEIDAPAPITRQPSDEAEPAKASEGEQEEQQAPDRVELIPGYTAEELKDIVSEVPKLRKALDSTNGTYGSRLAEQQRLIDELRNQKQQPADETQQKTASALSPERFSRLRKEFPELSELLEEVLGDVATPQSVDLSSVDQKIQSRLDEDRQAREQERFQREVRLLKREHPDYAEIAGYSPTENGLIQWNDPAFGNWVARQSREVQHQIISGKDAFDLADIITEYKKTRDAESANANKQKKQSNLAKAIQPRGAPAARTSFLDEEERLFQEEMDREEY